MKKIVIADYYYPNLEEEYKIFEKIEEEVTVIDCTKIKSGGLKEPEELLPYIEDADALIVQFAKVDRRVIERMKKCKVIARYAIGVDNIDLEAASEKHIYVANVPDYCIDEVANTAIAHIMNALRNLSNANGLLKNKKFEMGKIRPMYRMGNLTLGMVGFGHISRNVAAKMRLFFKEVKVYDPYFTEKEKYPEYTFTEFDEVIESADVISLHVPLNNHTKNLISTEEFEKMKQGVVLVNTARGGLIDEKALEHALKSGKVGFCGLDVLSTEDFENSPFLFKENVLLTPHMGWCSEEAVVELQRKVAENVVQTFLNGQPVYRVNKF